MRLNRMPAVKEGSVNVTPLIDIVMCMIIFFMLVAKIGIDSGRDPNIHIPISVLGTQIKDMGNTLTLNVVNPPNGSGAPGAQPMVTALVAGKMIELKLHDQENGQVQTPLRDVLTDIREGDPAHGLAANPDFKVIIRGDKTLTYQFLAPVLLECNLAHVQSFAFDTQKPD
jgi:biopolymer transport protein ExbD